MSNVSRIKKIYEGGEGSTKGPNPCSKGLRNKRSIKSPKAKLARELKRQMRSEKQWSGDNPRHD